MSSTISQYVNLSAPATSALVQGLNLLSAPPAPQFVVRDLVRHEVRFMTVTAGSRVGTAADIGATATLRFGAKLLSTFVTSDDYLFYSEDYTRDATDPADVFYYADIDLNTVEFVAAFTGGSNTASLKLEIEVEDSGRVQTVAQFGGQGLFDVIRSGSVPPTPSVPAYPSAPSAYVSLLGSTGTAWIQRTVTQVLALLGITGITTASTPGWAPGVVSILGAGATALEGTDGVTDGSTVFTEDRLFAFVTAAEGLKWAVLKAGTQATDGVDFVRPANYSAVTFEFVFNIVA